MSKTRRPGAGGGTSVPPMPPKFNDLTKQLERIRVQITKLDERRLELESSRSELVVQAVEVGPILQIAKAAGISRNLVYKIIDRSGE